MKQLTYIFFLFIPFTLYNCSNLESTLNNKQEETDQSRSISNIMNDDCTEFGIIPTDDEEKAIKPILPSLESRNKIYHLPSLKSPDFDNSSTENGRVGNQAIFDDYDPEMI